MPVSRIQRASKVRGDSQDLKSPGMDHDTSGTCHFRSQKKENFEGGTVLKKELQFEVLNNNYSDDAVRI